MAMPKSILLVAALIAGIVPLGAEVTHVDNAALERLIRRGVPVIDIRTPEEWRATGIIEGSHLLTFFAAPGSYGFRAWLSDLAAIAGRDDAFALICDSGGRSGVVGRFLDGRLGYRHVFDVPGGIVRWLADDRPTVAPD